MEGYDPIMLESIHISKWLEEDLDDNIVILGDYIFSNRKYKGIL